MLTLAQLCNAAIDNNIDIWGGLQLPEDSPMDRDVLINTIIEKCGLNIPLYAEPAVMASAIAVWSAKNQYTFDHVGKIYEASYSPIENYDRTEDIENTTNRNLGDNTRGNMIKGENMVGSGSKDNTMSHSGTDRNVDTNDVSAFNASTYQPDNKNTSEFTHGEVVNESGTMDNQTTKDTNTTTSQNKTINENIVNHTINRTHGNIGITSPMAMETEEMEYLKNYNPYTFLSGLFENELTLFVY